MATLRIAAWQPAARPHPRSPRSPLRAHLRHVGICLLVLANVIAAGAAVYGAKAVLTNPSSIAPVSSVSTAASEENPKAVRAFYDGVNEAIRTGDASPLDALVAPQLIWCSPCPAQAPDRAGLKRHVTDLHRLSPDMRLVVEEVVGGLAETVIVRLHVTGYPVAGEASPWGPVDTLRLVHGQIVERRNGTDTASLAEPLVGARFDALPPAVTGVVLARLSFAVGAGSDGLLSPGPTLLAIESGSLRVRIASGGQILRAGASGASVPRNAGPHDGTGTEVVLGPGDGAVVPAAVRHSLHQEGADPAVVLASTFVFQGDGSDRSRSRSPERGPFESIDSASDAPGLLPPDIRMLASERVEAWAPGPLRVAVGRAVLGPGASLYPPDGEAQLVAVESGTLELTGGTRRTIGAGMGDVEPPGLDRALQNVGSGLLVLLILTVSPDAT